MDGMDGGRVRRLAASVAVWVVLVAAATAALYGTMHVVSRAVDTSSPIGVAAPAVAPASGGGAALPLADFRLASLDGGTLGPPDYLGQVVVLDFWATWCGPCHLQADILETLHAELAGQPVRFLAVDVGEDEATVRRFVDRSPFPYPVLLDPDETVVRRYGIHGFPTVLVVDTTGAVSFRRVGVTDAPTLRAELRKAGLTI